MLWICWIIICPLITNLLCFVAALHLLSKSARHSTIYHYYFSVYTAENEQVLFAFSRLGCWSTTTCCPVAFRKVMCGVWKWTRRCSQAGWGWGQREEGSLAVPEASGTETLLSANVALLLLAAVSVVTHQKHTRAYTHKDMHTARRTSQTKSDWQT